MLSRGQQQEAKTKKKKNNSEFEFSLLEKSAITKLQTSSSILTNPKQIKTKIDKNRNLIFKWEESNQRAIINHHIVAIF